MKKCNRCGETKPPSDFRKRTKSKDGLQAWCRQCAQERHTKYYADNKDKWSLNEEKMRVKARKYILELFKTGCVDCGTVDPRVLTFDHTSNNKRTNVSNLMKNGLNVLKAEIAKCQIVCANCHLIRTSERAGWWRSKLGPFV